ncbi:MAG: hypothetical protein RR495_04925 [Anaerovoracaceae bacterium]
MKTNKQKYLSILVVLIMIFTMIPNYALAVPDDGKSQQTQCTHVHTDTCTPKEATPGTPCDKACSEVDTEGKTVHSTDCSFKEATEAVTCEHFPGDNCSPKDSESELGKPESAPGLPEEPSKAPEFKDDTVAVIGNKEFKSLKAAFNEAYALGFEPITIHLVKSTTVSSTLVIPMLSDFTLATLPSQTENLTVTVDSASSSNFDEFFKVEPQGKFTINGNLTIDGSNCSSTISHNARFVTNHGNFNLVNGTLKTAYSGNGVTSCGDDAVFNMSGGTITGVTGRNYNGAVKVCCNGTFNLSGGQITKNSVSNIEGGAGVLLAGALEGSNMYASGGATFNMSGGEITHNQGWYAGGVLLYGQHPSKLCKMTMTGGLIGNNTAISTVPRVSSAGGGVYSLLNSQFTMLGGTISDNSVTGGGYGGGVATFDGFDHSNRAGFTMEGGTIT